MIKRHYEFSGGKTAQASNTESAQSQVLLEVEGGIGGLKKSGGNK